MSFIKTLCSRCLTCVKDCFKSEEDELEQKMIELENKIHSPLPDRSHKFRFRQNDSNNYPDSNTQKQFNTYAIDKDDEFSFGESNKNRFKILTSSQKNQNNMMLEQQIPQMQTPMTFGRGRQYPNSVDFRHKNSPQHQYEAQVFSPNNNRNSNHSSDSFFTMQSGSLGSSNSVSRRTFQSLSKKSQQLRKRVLTNKTKSIEQEDFKSIQNRQSLMFALPALISADSKMQKYSQAMIDWNEKQYDIFGNAENGSKRNTMQQLGCGIQLSTAQLHKLSSNSYLDELVNKLQDYYMFFQPEQMIKAATTTNNNNKTTQANKSQLKLTQKTSLTQSNQYKSNIGTDKGIKQPNRQQKDADMIRRSGAGFSQYHPDKGYYINPITNIKCSYQCQSDSIFDRDFAIKSHSPTNFMKLITFFCNTSNPLQFLYWFNSIQVRARLYDFNTTLLIKNGVFPTFYVQQYSGLLPSKNKHQMVRQIELVKFENEPDKQYILQLDCTYGAGVGQQNGRNFSSLLRFEIGQNSMVQIYSESSETIQRGTHGDYFGQQWRNFQQKLIRDHIVKSEWKSSPPYPHK